MMTALPTRLIFKVNTQFENKKNPILAQKGSVNRYSIVFPVVEPMIPYSIFILKMRLLRYLVFQLIHAGAVPVDNRAISPAEIPMLAT